MKATEIKTKKITLATLKAYPNQCFFGKVKRIYNGGIMGLN